MEDLLLKKGSAEITPFLYNSFLRFGGIPPFPAGYVLGEMIEFYKYFYAEGSAPCIPYKYQKYIPEMEKPSKCVQVTFRPILKADNLIQM